MNTLEIKGAFISLLAGVEDEGLLREMLKKCVEIVERVDILDDLPSTVLSALEAAELDDDLANVIPNDDAFKQFRAWQKQ